MTAASGSIEGVQPWRLRPTTFDFSQEQREQELLELSGMFEKTELGYVALSQAVHRGFIPDPTLADAEGERVGRLFYQGDDSKSNDDRFNLLVSALHEELVVFKASEDN